MYQQVGQYVLHQLGGHGLLAGVLDRGRYQRHVHTLHVVVARLEQRQVRQHVVQNVLLGFDRFSFAVTNGRDLTALMVVVLLCFAGGQ